MEKEELEIWLQAGRASTLQILALGAEWWPMTSGGNQALSSAWALAFFVHAALDRCTAPVLTAACNAPSGDNKAKILAEMWTREPERLHEQEQVLVDFSIHNWDASSPVQLTGESEMHAQHGVGKSLGSEDDYSWDFYKLLVVPSSTRLFMARVAGRNGRSAGDRCAALADTLVEMIDWYGPSLVRPHDELGAVIIPSAKQERALTRVCWLQRGRLRQEVISADSWPEPLR